MGYTIRIGEQEIYWEDGKENAAFILPMPMNRWILPAASKKTV